MQEIEKNYSPKNIEQKWYDTWLDQKCFTPVKGKKKESFTIIMPPPNVTGILHMGHALDATTQDILTRYKRMQGFETLWVPGQDHAGIATQAKVEELIYKEEGKTKLDLGRDEFLKRVWAWKEKYGGTILEQQKKLGVSCDWDYFAFTMDEIPNEAVRKVFVTLFNEGLIYQSDYIINWDPVLQSAISDAEVDHKEVQGHFYHIHYKIKDSDDVLEVATTRPETLFGDTAVAVNAQDQRFAHLIGKKAIIPICQREVPIIGDEHVDMEKGTGCLKVTPGHDFNDFEIGQRHKLPIINILNKDGTLNHHASMVEGKSCAEARSLVVKHLEEIGQLVKVIPHVHQVGHGSRSDEIVEPMVSKQWFLNIDKMANQSVEMVENGDMTFFPKGWENTYFSYLRNPRPWCISRQLWWGHQIPVYYCGENKKHVWASELDPEECPDCGATNFTQDPDVLDTWFSSGIWPLSTLGWPNKKAMQEKKFDTFYPTTTLVTGFDIIFFWVARMMMMCSKMTKQSPFKHTYIHAIVRDKNGVKMSKSLGNIIDPLDIIDQYGCDALRFTLAASSGYNRNINLDPEKIEGYRNFINKIWNVFRFIAPNLELAGQANTLPAARDFDLQDRWILAELNQLTKIMSESIDEYRFDDASSALYSFVYDKFCSWYVEMSKNILYGEDQVKKVNRAKVLKYCFRQILKLIHPITPFISEELWSHLKSENEGLLISQEYPEYDLALEDKKVIEQMNKLIEMVVSVRNMRAEFQLSPKDEISVELFCDSHELAKFYFDSRYDLKSLARIKAGKVKPKNADRPKKSASFATAHTEIYIPLAGLVDLDQQVQKIRKEMEKTQVEYSKVAGKLNNEQFMGKAPENVVEEVRAKAADFQAKLSALETSLKNMQGE